MNAFPQDENNQSAISELYSILEESSIHSIAEKSIIEDDKIDNSFTDMRQYFEGIFVGKLLLIEEIRQLESRVFALQQSLSTQKEETEMIRKERDDLQNDVFKLEAELSDQRKAVTELERLEVEKGQEAEERSHTFRQEITELRKMNETLSVLKERNDDL